jgi:hypothetical protein
MPYTLPADVDERPMVIDGAGTLGRRTPRYTRAAAATCGSSTSRRSSARRPTTTSKSTLSRRSRRSGYTPPGVDRSRSATTCSRLSLAAGW